MFDGFHSIPDSQNTAVTKDFTKFEKSLLIAASSEANSDQIVQKTNVSIR